MIHSWIINGDDLLNVWAARTVIVNCWNVKPSDSCLLCRETCAILECGNLKKPFYVEHGHTHAKRNKIWHTKGVRSHCNRCIGTFLDKFLDFYYTCTGVEGTSPCLNCFLCPSSISWAMAHVVRWTSHMHISRNQAYLWGHSCSSHSLRAFPLPCSPRPNFRPVNPVNLMLKRSLQQSITAKTTESSLPAGVKHCSCRPQGASAGECTLCITQQSKQRQRHTGRLSPLTGRREPYC